MRQHDYLLNRVEGYGIHHSGFWAYNHIANLRKRHRLAYRPFPCATVNKRVCLETFLLLFAQFIAYCNDMNSYRRYCGYRSV
jgi:hypothetical protein